MNRKRLVDQYSGLPQISVPDDLQNDPEQLFKLIEPYLDWMLSQLDESSMDILISKRDADQKRLRLLILRGQAANTWLRYHRNVRA